MGSGSCHLAQITGPAKDNSKGASRATPNFFRAKTILQVFSSSTSKTDMDRESNQANRAISTGKLNASPRLHTQPINVVVFHGSQGSTRFEVGFPLRSTSTVPA